MHEITLCALPARKSMTSTLMSRQSPLEFGALRGRPWPALAIRRFMLYHVFLHEVGHLQIINERARSDRLKFAREEYAQEFATTWRNRLWAVAFIHPDPAHNRPTEEELETLCREALSNSLS
jgi:hypothetical protein